MKGLFPWKAATILWAATLLCGWIYSGGEWLLLINALFMIGLVLLMVAGAVFIGHGGLFDNFRRGWKQIKQASRRESGGFDEWDDDEEKEEKKKAPRYRVAPVCFAVGLVDVILSYVLVAWL
jgi:hypothetical protein